MDEATLAIRLEAFGPHHLEVAKSYNGVAVDQLALGEPAKALEGFERALAIRLELLGPNHLDVAATYGNIAIAQRALGEPARALAGHEKALAIRQEALGPRHPLVAQSYSNIAVAYLVLGEPTKSLHFEEKALAIRLEALGPRHPELAQSYHNIANLNIDLGEPASALAGYEKALAIWLEALGPRHPLIARGYAGMANAYHSLRQPAESLGYQEKSLAILLDAHGPRHPEIALLYNNIAATHAALGEPGEALEGYERALAIRLALFGPRHPNVVQCISNVANAQADLGEPAKALEGYEKVLATRLEAYGPRHPLVATSYSNVAAAHTTLGEPSKAIAALDRALDALVSPSDEARPAPPEGQPAFRPLPLTVRLLIRRSTARASVHPGDRANPAALSDLVVAAEILDRLRGPDSATGRDGASAADRLLQGEIAADLAPLTIGIAARLAEDEGDPARRVVALAAAERGAARIFLQDLGRAHAATVGRVAPAEIDEERRLDAQIRDIDRRIERAEAVGPDKRDVDAIRNLLESRRASERELYRWAARLESDYPQYAALKYPKPCSKEQARATLGDDEVALSFVTGSEASYLVVLPRMGEIAVHTLPRAEAIADRVAALLQPRVLEDADAARERGAELYRMLIGPAAEAIEGKALVVVPGGPLGQLPFEMLVEPDSGDGRFLVEGHRIRYAPSLTSLHMIGLWEGHRDQPERPLFAMGDPVYAPDDPRLDGGDRAGPSAESLAVAEKLRGGSRGPSFDRLEGTGAEVERITALMGAGPGDRLLGTDATEAAVARLAADGTLSKYRHVHFATHGVLGTADGTPPGLVLSLVGNSEGVDGYLRLDEVTNLKLNADLVVLSACQTGQGRVFKAEGVSGLARAFLYAGSRGVVCSLWQVDDAATAELMAGLYAGLKQGEPAAAALRSAQLDMIAAGEPPSHWAPFVLSGWPRRRPTSRPIALRWLSCAARRGSRATTRSEPAAGSGPEPSGPAGWAGPRAASHRGPRPPGAGRPRPPTAAGRHRPIGADACPARRPRAIVASGGRPVVESAGADRTPAGSAAIRSRGAARAWKLGPIPLGDRFLDRGGRLVAIGERADIQGDHRRVARHVGMVLPCHLWPR